MLNFLWYSRTRTTPSLRITFVPLATQPQPNSLGPSRIFRGTLQSSSIWSLHTKRAKWRSSLSVCSRVLRSCLTPPTLLEMAIFQQLHHLSIKSITYLRRQRGDTAVLGFAYFRHE